MSRRYREEGRVYQGSEFVGSRPFLTDVEVRDLRNFLRVLRNQEQTYEELTADQNDFRLANAIVHRFTSDASRRITGFLALDLDSQLRVIANVGGQDIVLGDDDAGSIESNRIISHTGSDITLNPNQSALIFYDRKSSRVRTIGF